MSGEQDVKNSSFFDRFGEIALGAVMVLLAALYLYFATTIRIRSTVSVSARLIPEILGVLVLLLGFAQLAFGVRTLREVRARDREAGATEVLITREEKRDALPVLLTFVLIFLYAVSFEWLGFVVASTLCIFIQMRILSPRGKFRPGLFAVISLASALVVYFAFRKGLNLMLPEGMLEYLPL